GYKKHTPSFKHSKEHCSIHHPKIEKVFYNCKPTKTCTVDKLIKKTNLALVIGTHSWREQFVEAVTVSAGDGDEDEEEGREERLPSCYDYVMHFLTVFWKVLFACVPPTEYWNGWACFMVSISVIGILTAIIGDLASHFGCTIGLKDTVTAVVFVALGTSIPAMSVPVLTFNWEVLAINVSLHYTTVPLECITITQYITSPSSTYRLLM
uniref:Sodium/calcium exchanger membrane region domain-containing protein n=1 Tax=Astyanax mexicanus TaxID=7994 RepID=A0A3B1KL79_ASTMX